MTIWRYGDIEARIGRPLTGEEVRVLRDALGPQIVAEAEALLNRALRGRTITEPHVLPEAVSFLPLNHTPVTSIAVKAASARPSAPPML